MRTKSAIPGISAPGAGALSRGANASFTSFFDLGPQCERNLNIHLFLQDLSIIIGRGKHAIGIGAEECIEGRKSGHESPSQHLFA